jgi:crotonobetaine/carnitine-CoA ligase
MNELREDDILHSALPVAHGNALILTVYAAFVAEATAAISPRFSASSFESELADSRATFTNILGSMSNIVLEQPETATSRLSLRKAFVIPVSPEVQQALEKRFRCTVTSAYGLSDAGLPILTGIGFPPGACGRLLDQLWEARIVDAENRDVPQGKSGELWVRGKRERVSAFGYWGMPEETAERYRDGWIATGDLFKVDADGWFFFIDRAKDAIRRRGENISSQEVENAILSHPAVLDCAVYPVPSEMSEDEVMVSLIVKPGQSMAELDLIKFIERKLPYFAVPRFVRKVDRLPRTETQKVQKLELRKEGVTGDTWDRNESGYQLSR